MTMANPIMEAAWLEWSHLGSGTDKLELFAPAEDGQTLELGAVTIPTTTIAHERYRVEFRLLRANGLEWAPVGFTCDHAECRALSI